MDVSVGTPQKKGFLPLRHTPSDLRAKLTKKSQLVEVSIVEDTDEEALATMYQEAKRGPPTFHRRTQSIAPMNPQAETLFPSESTYTAAKVTGHTNFVVQNI